MRACGWNRRHHAEHGNTGDLRAVGVASLVVRAVEHCAVENCAGDLLAVDVGSWGLVHWSMVPATFMQLESVSVLW